MSMDDFYLTKAERQARGMRWRAVPGSHDVEMLVGVLDAIREGTVPFDVPVFSHATDDRTGMRTIDRTPATTLLEGLFIGSDIGRYPEVTGRLDQLVFIDVPLDVAKRRRFSREAELQARGSGMTDDEMQRFWDEALSPGLEDWLAQAKARADVIVSEDT